MSLKIEDLGVKIGDKEVLKKVDIEVGEGEIVALMGPNGSGKSSLAYALMGHPRYEVLEGSKIEVDGSDLLEMSVDKRARAGLFMAFQYPVGVEGVRIREMLLAALRERGKKIKAIDLQKRLRKESEKMEIKSELLKRGLNFDFSGGEKKKMEILQMKILEPKYAVLDETDSGLDIDALKQVARAANEEAQRGAGLLVITHYRRILEHLKPDRVVVLKSGRVVEKGGKELADRLEREGYKDIE